MDKWENSTQLNSVFALFFGNTFFYFSYFEKLYYWERVKIEGYRRIDLLHKNRYIDNGHIDYDVIKLSIIPKMDRDRAISDMSKNGSIWQKKIQFFPYSKGKNKGWS